MDVFAVLGAIYGYKRYTWDIRDSTLRLKTYVETRLLRSLVSISSTLLNRLFLLEILKKLNKCLSRNTRLQLLHSFFKLQNKILLQNKLARQGLGGQTHSDRYSGTSRIFRGGGQGSTSDGYTQKCVFAIFRRYRIFDLWAKIVGNRVGTGSPASDPVGYWPGDPVSLLAILAGWSR